MKLSEEHKLKISLTLSGTKQSEETKKKRSDALKGYKWKKADYDNRRGEKHHNWKGGKWTNDEEYRSWLSNRHYYRKRDAVGSHSFVEWEELKKICNYTCQNCFIKEPKIKLTVDHIIALSKGGSDDIINIQPLCKRCNSKKWTN